MVGILLSHKLLYNEYIPSVVPQPSVVPLPVEYQKVQKLNIFPSIEI